MKKIVLILILLTNYSCQRTTVINTATEQPALDRNSTIEDMKKVSYDKKAWNVLVILPIENRKVAATIAMQNITRELTEENINHKKLNTLLSNLLRTRYDIGIDNLMFILTDGRFTEETKSSVFGIIQARFLIQYRAKIRELVLSDSYSLAFDAVVTCGFLIDKECLPYIEKFRLKYGEEQTKYIVNNTLYFINKGLRHYLFSIDAREDENNVQLTK